MLSGDVAHHVACCLRTTINSCIVSEGNQSLKLGQNPALAMREVVMRRLATSAHKGNATLGKSSMDQDQRKLACLDPVICTQTVCITRETSNIAAE